MIYLIKGRSGTGKTTYLHDLFRSLSEHDEKLLFIVPDNCTFETENRFIDEIGVRYASNIKVRGFTSLCSEIFEMTGQNNLKFADEGIRHVIMNMAIKSCEKQLDVFKSRARSKDLCDLMLSTLKEFKMRFITPDDLENASDKVSNEKLQKKLSETAKIFNAYETYLSLSYMDPYDMLTKAMQLLKSHRLFEGYTVAVDSHKAFNRQQYGFLKVLCEQSKDIYFSVLTDDRYVSPGELFYTNCKMAEKLLETAQSVGVKEGKSDFIPVERRFMHDDLKAVEKNVFRRDIDQYKGESDHILLYSAQSIYDECDFVARTIRKLVNQENYRYKDISVISRHPDMYQNVLDLSLKKYGISYFISKSQSIDSKPFVRLVSSCFDILNDSYDKDDILTLLKTGLTFFTADEISVFENYVFTWDVSGKKFFDEFKSNPRGFSDDFTDDDRESLKTAEKIRKTLIDALRVFDESTKNATGDQIINALMTLLYTLEIDKNTVRLAKELDEKEYKGGEEIYRMWNLVMDIFDRIISVTKDFRFSMRRFSELLYTHISNSDISYIPSGIDQVTLYDVTNLSINDSRAVFLVGCNDTMFPDTNLEYGLFSGSECSVLQHCDLDLSDTLEEKTSGENMYVYAALTRVKEKLFVSCYRQEMNGDPVEPSPVFNEIERAVVNVRKSSYDMTDVEDRLWSEESAFEYLTENYTDESKGLSSLKEYFENIPEYSAVLGHIEESAQNKQKEIYDKKLAQKLFSKNIRLSASQVDRFYSCRFEYFIQYGLRINERKKAVIDSLEYGTLIHYVLESYIRNHKNDNFSQINQDSVAPEIKRILLSYANNHLGGLEDKSGRFLYLFKRIEKTAITLVSRLVKELAQCDFVPVDFELNIGHDIPAYELKVSDDITLTLNGSIDRVDRFEKDGKTYIRIIDYKTGTKEFDLYDILYGINLQMLLYMSAIEKNGKNKYGEITPAGILYSPAKDPVISNADTDEEIEKKKNKELRMKGVILNDDDVIAAMDKERQGTYIPVSYNKSGSITPASMMNVASLSEFGLISRKIDSLLIDMAKELSDGKIEDVPIKGKKDSCRYCPYMCVCNHNDSDPYRVIEKHTREEFYSELGEAQK